MRAGFRLARVGLHLLWALATVAFVFPWITAGAQRALKRRWSRQLVSTLGVKLKVGAGGAARVNLPAGMIVSNHVSWLDIYVINALAPAAFVAKDDVKDWPLIGWLCARTENIFIERGSRAAAQRTRETMVAQLQSGRHVVVFPEGTTSGGDRLLPFHGALFQSAIDAGATVVPLALRYVGPTGEPSRAPAYDGDISLWQSLVSIARSSRLEAQLRVLTPLSAGSTNRRQLAARCHQTIAFHLGHATSTGTVTTTANPSAWQPAHKASDISADLPVAQQSDCHPIDNPNPARASCPSA